MRPETVVASCRTAPSGHGHIGGALHPVKNSCRDPQTTGEQFQCFCRRMSRPEAADRQVLTRNMAQSRNEDSWQSSSAQEMQKPSPAQPTTEGSWDNSA